jgi:hypothetical protein
MSESRLRELNHKLVKAENAGDTRSVLRLAKEFDRARRDNVRASLTPERIEVK